MEGVQIGNLQIPAIKGDKGDKGDAGKIVGLSITMLSSTATPTVTNVGTQSEANYILGIPKGTGVASVVKNDDGELVITLTDSTVVNLGSIEATSIANVEIDEEFNLIVTLTDSTEINAGNLDDELSDIIDTHLANYYTKSEVYNKTELANVLTNAVAAGKQIAFSRLSGSSFYVDLTSTFNSYQTKIDSSHKLSADYVIDTTTTNKFVTASDKTAWNAKYDKPSGGIPSTDLASAVQTSLGKADTALQSADITGKEDTSNKSTTITSSSTDTQYASAKAVYTYVTSVVGDINSVLDEINGEVV